MIPDGCVYKSDEKVRERESWGKKKTDRQIETDIQRQTGTDRQLETVIQRQTDR